MRFASALSRHTVTETALEEALQQLIAALDPAEGAIDLLVLFCTSHHLHNVVALVRTLQTRLSPGCLLGCSAGDVLGLGGRSGPGSEAGPGQRLDRQPGISLLAARLPGIMAAPFHAAHARWTLLHEEPELLLDQVGYTGAGRAWLVLGDPRSTPHRSLLRILSTVAPGCPVVGGLASGSPQGAGALLLNNHIFSSGVVGVLLSGPLEVTTLLAQACRPVGRPLMVTSAGPRTIRTLGHRPALKVVRDLMDRLPEEDRALAQQQLFLGVVINEYQAGFGRGDFLVREVRGWELANGALSIPDDVSVGQTVQFHVRDTAAANRQLQELLAPGGVGLEPAGALVFTGAGSEGALARVDEAYPGLPAAGFVDEGEFAPARGASYLHTHTTSVVLFRERRD